MGGGGGHGFLSHVEGSTAGGQTGEPCKIQPVGRRPLLSCCQCFIGPESFLSDERAMNYAFCASMATSSMSGPIDIRKAREETQGCSAAERRIHLNNAGAAFAPRPVMRVVHAHLDLEQSVGGYEAAALRQNEIDSAYADIARLINCKSSEISCVENATRAFDLAFSTLVHGACTLAEDAAARRPLSTDSVLITTASEYGSNHLSLVQLTKKYSCELIVLPHEDNKTFSLSHLESVLQKYGTRVFLLNLCWIATSNGVVHPAEEVGKLCRKYDVPFLLDACQAVGQIEVDVRALQCDALFATGRKFLRGPRGTGFLYVREGEDSPFYGVEPVFLDIHSARLTPRDETTDYSYNVHEGSRRFEAWERPVALWLGLGAAAKYANGIGMDRIAARVGELGKALREMLAAVDGVRVMDSCEKGMHMCGIVTFRVDAMPSEDVKARLYEAGVNVSVSNKWSTLADMQARGIPDVVRASVHYYNTEDEIRTFVNKLGKVVHDSTSKSLV